MKTKICFSCDVEKPISEFHRDGLRHKPWCKPCRASIRKEHSNGRIGKEAELRAHLKARYGLSLEDRDRMLKEQHGKCKICLEELVKINVDHCHSSGRVRGLLCPNCNKALGLFKDNVETLRRAAEYLD